LLKIIKAEEAKALLQDEQRTLMAKYRQADESGSA